MAGGNGKWPSHYKGLNMQLPWDPSNGMVEHLSQENDNPCSHKNLHTKVHCSFAHRAKNCSNGTPCWQVKSLRIPDHGILLSQIKESTIGTLTRSNLQRLVLPEKSQSPKVAHLWFHWSNTLELRKSAMKSRWVAARGQGWQWDKGNVLYADWEGGNESPLWENQKNQPNTHPVQTGEGMWDWEAQAQQVCPPSAEAVGVHQLHQFC